MVGVHQARVLPQRLLELGHIAQGYQEPELAVLGAGTDGDAAIRPVRARDPQPRARRLRERPAGVEARTSVRPIVRMHQVEQRLAAQHLHLPAQRGRHRGTGVDHPPGEIEDQEGVRRITPKLFQIELPLASREGGRQDGFERTDGLDPRVVAHGAAQREDEGADHHQVGPDGHAQRRMETALHRGARPRHVVARHQWVYAQRSPFGDRAQHRQTQAHPGAFARGLERPVARGPVVVGPAEERHPVRRAREEHVHIIPLRGHPDAPPRGHQRRAEVGREQDVLAQRVGQVPHGIGGELTRRRRFRREWFEPLQRWATVPPTADRGRAMGARSRGTRAPSIR
jgi:hypothetical protein